MFQIQFPSKGTPLKRDFEETQDVPESLRTTKRRRIFKTEDSDVESDYYSCSEDNLNALSSSSNNANNSIIKEESNSILDETSSSSKQENDSQSSLYASDTSNSTPISSKKKRFTPFTPKSRSQVVQKKSFFSPEFSTPTQTPLLDESSFLADEETSESQANILQTSTVPLDWSIKSEIRILSQTPFEWCNATSSINESLGLLEFVKCSAGNPALEVEEKDKISRHCVSFKKYLHYFVHPSASLAPCQWNPIKERLIAERKNKDDEYLTFFEQRKNIWGESLRSLYFMLRNKLCPYFYVQTSTFTVLFLAAGIAGYPQTTALMNKSTRSIRDKLRKADIPFDIPLNTKLDDKQEEEGKQESLRELLELKAQSEKINIQIKAYPFFFLSLSCFLNIFTQTAKPKVQQAEVEASSLLLFKGHVAVHSLFDFLLHLEIIEDVPLLFSPVAFQNATVSQAQMKNNGKLLRKNKITLALEEFYCLELSGNILPWSVVHIFETFKNSQKGSFTATLKTSRQTTGFNMFFEKLERSDSGSQVTTSSPSSSPRSKALVESQMMAFEGLKSPPSLGKEVIKRIHFSNGIFSVTTGN